jgi:rubrerythrin
VPDFNPGTLVQRSVSQYVEGESLAGMIREDLVAERVVIQVYQEMIRFFGEADPTTRRMLEHVLEQEEEHASELSDMLYIVDPQSGRTEGMDPGADPLQLQAGRTEQTGRTGSANTAQSTAGSRNIAAASDRDASSNRVPAERTPGTTGRPMNRRGMQEEEIDREDIAAGPSAGANSGGTRSPKVLEKNRKTRRAA